MSESLYNIFYQSHTGTWILIPILFLVSCFFLRQKVTPMILRLLYLIMVISGIGMLIELNFPLALSIKGILAFALIAIMETTLARLREKKPILLFGVIWLVLMILVPLIGYQVISF